MKTNIFLLFLCFLFLNQSYAQEIHLRETMIETHESGNRNKVLDRNYKYDFRVGDGEYQSVGKNGKNLRPYIKDRKALAAFDSSVKKAKLSNKLILVTLVGTGVLVAGGIKAGKDVDESESGKVNFFNGLTITGIGILLSKSLLRGTLNKKARQSLRESVNLQNNSFSRKKSTSLNKIKPDRLGLDYNDREGGVQVKMAWKF